MSKRSTFNTNQILREIKRISSRKNKILAWFKGRSDGPVQLYGLNTSSSQFERECQWLLKQQQRAAEIQTKAKKNTTEWIRRYQNFRDKPTRELETIDSRIATIQADSVGAHCKIPGTSRRSALIFFTLMFLFEFFFSAVALISSGLGSAGFELAIAVIAAIALVWLSEIAGKRMRQLPLPEAAGRSERYSHAIELVLSCLGLAAILVGVNFLRSLIDVASTSAKPNPIVQWALFTIGVGLVLVGVFKSSEHEYSGPKYGLAALERMRIQRHREMAACDFRIQQLSEFPDHLERIAQSSIKVVYAIYLDQYKRRSQKAA